MEFALDAPWRLEPQVDGGTTTYGPIPITAVVHDANFSNKSLSPGDKRVGIFVRLEIAEEWLDDRGERVRILSRVSPQRLQELEIKRRISKVGDEPPRLTCKPKNNPCPDFFFNVSDTNEWHASHWYKMKGPLTPGRDVHLTVTMISKFELPNNAFQERRWTNFLKVHLGQEPLPRFSKEWAYGDFHYHSQMTDNEGESGYSYRNVLRAIGAMGLDFVFATDHASGGRQHASGDEARDLNKTRFGRAKEILYGTNGVNSATVSEAISAGSVPVYKKLHRMPQIYMGEELDAVPIVSDAERNAAAIGYGDGQKYIFCKKLPANTTPVPVCPEMFTTKVGSNLWSIKDKQGAVLTSLFSSRQHVIYFPNDTRPNATGWIADFTGKFGGAKRFLTEFGPEISKFGMGFLAHPTEGSKVDSDHAPDIIPYSTVALDTAWQYSGILGLQLWNEDANNSEKGSGLNEISPSNYPFMVDRLVNGKKQVIYHLPWPQDTFTKNFPWQWRNRLVKRHDANGKEMDTRGKIREVTTNASVHHGLVTWDRYLRKGLNPNATAGLKWLDGTPRKWFAAGGSDGHGDFNYRRQGHPDGGFTGLDAWTDRPVNDTAIGKPRNLVLAGDPLGDFREQLMEGIKNGRFSVTNGPALSISVRTRRTSRAEMGSTVHVYPNELVPVRVDWKSTTEFGPMKFVELYVGNMDQTFVIGGKGIQRDIQGGLRFPYTKRYGLKANGEANTSPLPISTLPSEVQKSGSMTYMLNLRHFDAVANGHDKLYVRAIIRNESGDRQAISNPIWFDMKPTCRNGDAAAISLDVDEVPDICQGNVYSASGPCIKPPREGIDPRSGRYQRDIIVDAALRKAKSWMRRSCRIVTLKDPQGPTLCDPRLSNCGVIPGSAANGLE